MTVDDSGHTVLMGVFKGIVDFGGGNIVSNDPSLGDIFIAKFVGDGGHVWSRGLGTEQSGPMSLALDNSGDVYAIGSFKGSMNAGGADLVSAGSVDVFLAKFGTDAAVSAVEDTPRLGSAVRAYPNPFNPSTTIQFTTRSAGHVMVAIYDVRGTRVATLANATFTAGVHMRYWNGRDDANRPVPSGAYFVRMSHASETSSYKIVLAR